MPEVRFPRCVIHVALAIALLGLGREAAAHDWNGIALRHDGSVLVIDGESGRIWAVSLSGRVETVVSEEEGEKIGHPHHLAIDPGGTIWFPQGCGKGLIYKIPPGGRVEEHHYQTLPGLETVVPDGSGGLYLLTVTAVHRLEPEGKAPLLAGGFGDLSAGAAAPAPGGGLLLADGFLLKRVTPEGRVVPLPYHPDPPQGLPFGLAAGPGGSVLVADWERNFVFRVTEDGRYSRLAGSGRAGHRDGEGSEAEFYHPSGVVLDPQGNLYVMESGRNEPGERLLRVRKVTPEDQVTTLARISLEPAPTENQLTAAEKAEGWILLFDGKTLNGWTTSGLKPSRTPVEEASINPHQCGDYMMVHEKEWSDFVLSLDFKISKGCNSGIFIRTYSLMSRPGKDVGYNGLEVAIDDTPGAGYHDTGAIYDLVKPTRYAMKKVGEWNHAVITCDRNLIQVELNGEVVTRMDLDQWKEVGKRPDGSAHKFDVAYRDHPRKGYLGLQDHGANCWFKNVKLRPLAH